MIIKRPKVKACVIQVAEYSGAQYVKGSNHRISVYDTTHEKVFKIVEDALMNAAKNVETKSSKTKAS